MNKVYAAYKPCEKPKPILEGLGWFEDEVGFYYIEGYLKANAD